MKKIILTLLIISLLSVIIACGESIDEPDNTSAVETDGLESETEITEPREQLEVPGDKDYNGYDFKIFVYDEPERSKNHKATELNGDIINDSVYERNKKVEEMFNINITWGENPWGNEETRTTITNNVMAGDDYYDMYSANTYNMTYLSSQGMFKRIADIPYLNPEKPWWNQFVYNELSVGDNAYLLTGDIELSNYGAYYSIFFNKSYIEDYGFDNPYDLVYNDQWYIDKLISMTKDFYIDLNGNGVRDGYEDGGDIYGFFAQMQSFYDVTNNWVKITTKNNENYPEVTFYSERTATMFDKMKEFLKNSTGVSSPMGWTSLGAFSDGFAVFAPYTISSGLSLRDSDIEYGFVPIPKYDELQEDYATCTAGMILAIPTTANDVERSGMIIESLAYYGREFVYPAYVEDSITQKGTRDEDAQYMLEIILNSGYFNFGVGFSGFQGYGYGLLEYYRTDQGFASWYETYSPKATQELIDYADTILALE